MKQFFTIALIVFLSVGRMPAAFATMCDPAGADAAAVAAARADVEAHCDCSGLTSHRDYVACASTIVTTRVGNGQLPKQCKSLVKKSASKSSCGEPAAVSCCVTGASGATKCRIKGDEMRCGASGSATACVGSYPSCSDACTATGCAPAPLLSPLPTPTPCGGPCPSHIQTVFIILMENHDWSSIKGNPSAPYINSVLLPMASHAEQYYNPPNVHPSEPNYLWLEAGTDFGIADDADPVVNHQSSTSHLVTLLNNAGVSWKAYEENIAGNVCPLTTLGLYAAKHDPFVYFDDVTDVNNAYAASCINHVRPYTELQTDLQSGAVARYNFITPNLCDDMHDDCAPANDSVAQGDAWLSTEVPKILGSQAYTNNGALFVTWDEAENGDGPIGMIVLSPLAKGGGYSNSIHYTHSSTLRTVQEILGVAPLLGDAANAADLADLFSTFP